MPRPSVRALLVGSSVDAVGCTFALAAAATYAAGSGGLRAAAYLANAQMIGYALGSLAAGPIAGVVAPRAALLGSLALSTWGRWALVVAVTAGAPLRTVAIVAGLFELVKAVSVTLAQAELTARRPAGEAIVRSGAALSVGMGCGAALGTFATSPATGVLAALTALPMVVAVLRARDIARPATSSQRHVIRQVAAPLAFGWLVAALAFGPIVLNVALTSAVAGPAWVPLGLLIASAAAVLAPPALRALRDRIGDAGAPLPLLIVIAATVWAGWGLAPIGVPVLLAVQALSGVALHTYGALHADLLLRRVGPGDAATVLGLRSLTWQLSFAVAAVALPRTVEETGIVGTAVLHLALLAAVGVLGWQLRRRAPAGAVPAPS